MDKLKAILDNKATWATIGAVVGVVAGDYAQMIVNALGALVMVVI